MNHSEQRDDPRFAPGSPVVIRDRTAIAAWVFMAVWMGMLALMTLVLARDGPHPSQPADLQYAVIAIFWLVGIPVSAQMLATPLTRLVVDAAGSVTIHRRSVLMREVETFAPGALAVEVRPGKDDEGNLVCRTTLVARDGRERLARAGPSREEQESLAERLRAALSAPLAESAPPP